jgi:DNA-binding FadR family transcriptional regulator
MAMKKIDRSPAADIAAGILRREILSRPAGSYLGAEDELLQQLGISRPTFRQAARLLLHEQLVTIKKGAHGGFYTRKPSIGAVAHSASIWLQVENASMQNMVEAALPVGQEIVRTSAQCTDSALLGKLRKWVVIERQANRAGQSLESFLRMEIEMVEQLGGLCGNPALKLFLAILYDFGIAQTAVPVFRGHRERTTQWRDLRLTLADAILAHEPERAVSLWQQSWEMMSKWIRRELGAAGMSRAMKGQSSRAIDSDQA